MPSQTDIQEPRRRLPAGSEVGPYCVIGEDVHFEGPCKLHERVSIHGHTTVGAGCEFFQGCVVGTIPQDLKYAGEQTELKIGKHNIFREYVTVHAGTSGGGGLTRIGDDNLFMAYSHVAHDCRIENHVVLANSVGLSGHVQIDDWVIIGGMTGVIQFARIGKHAHVGGQLRITKDVAPYCRVAGEDKVHIIGVNSIGLQRREFSKRVIDDLKAAIHVLLTKNLTTQEALDRLKNPAPRPEVLELIDFIQSSKLGIHK